MPQDQFKGPEEMVQEVRLTIPVNLSVWEVKRSTSRLTGQLRILADF